MRRLLLSITILVLGILTLYPGIYAADQNANKNNTNTVNGKMDFSEVNLLFVLTAKKAVLKTNSNKSGYYTLTLYGVNPYITYFSDRPSRIQGLAATENFIEAWNVGPNNFKTNPPNAAITATKINMLENDNGQFYIVTMSQPKYDSQKSILQFTVKPLQQKLLFKDIQLDNPTIVIDS
jgi:hypothetical protein